MPDDDFQDLIRRVRAADPEAARVVVERYAEAVRRVVRFRLTDPRLRAAFDSMDVCQSVLGSFFVRAAHGEYELDDPEQLTRLLVGIARRKLAAQIRRETADRRDCRREAGGADPDRLPGGAPTPSRCAEARDLLEAVRARLTPDELRLAELRQAGLGWGEIAEHLGDSPAALRKRLSRALERVAGELGLDGPNA